MKILEAKRDKLNIHGQATVDGVAAVVVRAVYLVEDRRFASVIDMQGKTKEQVIKEADEAVKDSIVAYGDFDDEVEINITGEFETIYD